MVRDDLYITVPSFFRCPISLDVMKSPVSLCTGVTYDRASIQRWLDSGNNTCPATMQVLQSKEFVPNRTLQRLIQIWSDSVQRRGGGGGLPEDSTLPVVLSQDQVKDIVKVTVTVTDVKSEDFVGNLSKIVSFAKESDENKAFLAKLDGFVSMLVEILSNVNDVDILERVVRVLDLISSKIEDQQQLTELMLKSDQDCLDSLLLVLQQQQSLDSIIDTLKILEFIATDAESKLKIAEKEGLITEILKSLGSESDRKLIDAGLSCLIAISMPKRVKLKLINEKKIIREVKRLITDPNSTESVSEKALKLLEMMCSTKQGRSEISCDTSLAQAIVHRLLKVSSAATEHAVTILWSVCYLFRDQRAQEAVTTANGLTKILLLMQSNCSPAVRQMSADLLKIFRVNYKSCLSGYDTKTTHIMPF